MWVISVHVTIYNILYYKKYKIFYKTITYYKIFFKTYTFFFFFVLNINSFQMSLACIVNVIMNFIFKKLYPNKCIINTQLK